MSDVSYFIEFDYDSKVSVGRTECEISYLFLVQLNQGLDKQISSLADLIKKWEFYQKNFKTKDKSSEDKPSEEVRMKEDSVKELKEENQKNESELKKVDECHKHKCLCSTFKDSRQGKLNENSYDSQLSIPEEIEKVGRTIPNLKNFYKKSLNHERNTFNSLKTERVKSAVLFPSDFVQRYIKGLEEIKADKAKQKDPRKPKDDSFFVGITNDDKKRYPVLSDDYEIYLKHLSDEETIAFIFQEIATGACCDCRESRRDRLRRKIQKRKEEESLKSKDRSNTNEKLLAVPEKNKECEAEPVMECMANESKQNESSNIKPSKKQKKKTKKRKVKKQKDSNANKEISEEECTSLENEVEKQPFSSINESGIERDLNKSTDGLGKQVIEEESVKNNPLTNDKKTKDHSSTKSDELLKTNIKLHYDYRYLDDLLKETFTINDFTFNPLERSIDLAGKITDETLRQWSQNTNQRIFKKRTDKIQGIIDSNEFELRKFIYEKLKELETKKEELELTLKNERIKETLVNHLQNLNDLFYSEED